MTFVGPLRHAPAPRFRLRGLHLRGGRQVQAGAQAARDHAAVLPVAAVCAATATGDRRPGELLRAHRALGRSVSKLEPRVSEDD